ncbi:MULTISPECIES: hypothetical protein [Rhodopseudomonas]|uniref:Adenylate cyclase MASE7 domain-containing protein n=1 Tax=Rhodopseudomonas palustris TaxID=1076 RepID=A0A0D7E0X9_RHOPL|nr:MULTISPECIES: hypothetical protein [Rhodopseudomonas]KIZ34135.1 hypothetical protein OO17_27270 [Rhodopseudomonas palustris]MDF3812161.1 hypothetical protein [Rhodopseudomonas sp. BAL398]WOK16551.1 hypothetical protein RBJ75_20695 [Rhodopseudomonas sp. BAL398]
MSAKARLLAYASNNDSLAGVGNLIALVLAGNGPFYPIYVALVAGTDGMPWLLLSALSFPFFLMVPAIARRHPLLGRIVLSLVATLNTVFCTWLLGEAAGTELFLLPCAMLASLLFRPSERLLMLLLAGLPVAAYLLLHGNYAAPPHLYSPQASAALFSMNAVSAGMITIFMGIVFSGLRAATPDRTTPAG